MDRYTRQRGGSSIWTDGTPASNIINTDFFGANQNQFWIKIAGVWKQATAWIKISGVWKQTTAKIKASGTWH